MTLLMLLLCCSLATISSGHAIIGTGSTSVKTSQNVRNLVPAARTTAANAHGARHISKWAINRHEGFFHCQDHQQYRGSVAFCSAVLPTFLSRSRSGSGRCGFCAKSPTNVRSRRTVRVEVAPPTASTMEREARRRRGTGDAMMEEEPGASWHDDADMGVRSGVMEDPCKVKLGRNGLEVCRVINGLSQVRQQLLLCIIVVSIISIV